MRTQQCSATDQLRHSRMRITARQLPANRENRTCFGFHDSCDESEHTSRSKFRSIRFGMSNLAAARQLFAFGSVETIAGHDGLHRISQFRERMLVCAKLLLKALAEISA